MGITVPNSKSRPGLQSLGTLWSPEALPPFGMHFARLRVRMGWSSMSLVMGGSSPVPR